MFVDTAKVKLQAGKGGDGAVSFRHEIYIPKGGPDGGDGGKGGSIIFRADKDTNTLLNFRFTPELKAEDGKNGSGTRSAGRSGKDLIIEVPIGTTVWRASGEKRPFEGSKTWASAPERPENGPSPASERTLIADLVYDGQEAVIARGGDGGFGNAHFKSSTRQAPIIAEVGEPGEAFEAELELKLLADVGLVGLPNAGKSTFLSVVSNAKPEIADYPFTTITPNLGVATIDGKDLLIADIPGLIEGASEGKGLGHAFLRHIDRTAVLLHLVDVYNDDAGEAYATIRKELEKYSDLKDRPEIVALTKCEGLDEEIIDLQKQSILAKNPKAKIFAISSSAHEGLTPLLRTLAAKVRVSSEFGVLSESASPSSQNHQHSRTETRNCNSGAGSPECCDFDDCGLKPRTKPEPEDAVPTISLPKSATKTTWKIAKTDDNKFVVTGEKIEKFARRTNYNNYASVNRLRDIMKKLGIRAELTGQGATPESIISISGHEFTLVEDW